MVVYKWYDKELWTKYVAEPSPPDKNRNISFFYRKIGLFGHYHAQHDSLDISDHLEQL